MFCMRSCCSFFLKYPHHHRHHPDIESPTVSCQGNITTSTDPEMNYATVIIDDPVVNDNSGDIKLNLPDSYRVYIGVSAVRFEAVDEEGNSAACSVFVTVEGIRTKPLVIVVLIKIILSHVNEKYLYEYFKIHFCKNNDIRTCINSLSFFYLRNIS